MWQTPGSDDVTVIDGTTNSVTTLAMGPSPVALDVSTKTNYVYAAQFR